jgi:hypothetical protein
VPSTSPRLESTALTAPAVVASHTSTAPTEHIYLESLRSLSIATVFVISPVGAAGVPNRFEQGHSSGAMLVTTG